MGRSARLDSICEKNLRASETKWRSRAFNMTCSTKGDEVLMRLNDGILWTAWATLAVVWPLVQASGQHNGPVRPNPNIMLTQFEGQSPEDGSARPEGDTETATSSAASSERKDTRLTLKDIQRLREQRIAPERIVEKVAEQGRAFDVTAEVAEELRRQGFSPLQVHAVQESSADPLVPGKWLTTSDKQRNRILAAMKQIAAKSDVDIKPIQSQHVTLWAVKDIQQTYLADIENLEKFFHTKCAEPIRSGLDKRSAHIILLNNHADYEAWCRAMFDVFSERFDPKNDPDSYVFSEGFDQKNNPVANANYREQVLKRPAYYSTYFVSISLEAEDNPLGQVHHHVVGGVGGMYFSQLAEPRRFIYGPLETGFINGAETAVFGSPTVMFHDIVYGLETSDPRQDGRNWACWPDSAWRPTRQHHWASCFKWMPPRCCSRITLRHGRLWSFWPASPASSENCCSRCGTTTLNWRPLRRSTDGTRSTRPRVANVTS